MHSMPCKAARRDLHTAQTHPAYMLHSPTYRSGVMQLWYRSTEPPSLLNHEMLHRLQKH